MPSSRCSTARTATTAGIITTAATCTATTASTIRAIITTAAITITAAGDRPAGLSMEGLPSRDGSPFRFRMD